MYTWVSTNCERLNDSKRCSPVQQLESYSVSIVMWQDVDPLPWKTQLSNQSLHQTSLLKDGVTVWSLEKIVTSKMFGENNGGM